ncbi:hypothetical protein ABZ805_07160 [Saccharopolyspora sp. NPDC047091]|uniref:hypothetical protein n=1 Tax=Saccharopolyspora sp. NPDC047091 TaxID=3155924 RepID=UPI00340F4E1D
MGAINSGPKLATVLRRPFRCVVCEYALFWSRQIKMNTGGAEFLDLAWANRSATGLICARCGYVHEFAGRKRPELWTERKGYPEADAG